MIVTRPSDLPRFTERTDNVEPTRNQRRINAAHRRHSGTIHAYFYMNGRRDSQVTCRIRPMPKLAPLLLCALLCSTAIAVAQENLPLPIKVALDKAGIAPSAISIVVMPVNGVQPSFVHQATQLVSPASTMKLLTTL